MTRFIIGECQQCGQIIAAAVYDKKYANKDANSFLDGGLRVSVQELETVKLKRCEHYAKPAPKSETPDNFDEGLTMVAATLRQHRQDGTASFVLRARDELAAKERDLAEAVKKNVLLEAAIHDSSVHDGEGNIIEVDAEDLEYRLAEIAARPPGAGGVADA